MQTKCDSLEEAAARVPLGIYRHTKGGGEYWVSGYIFLSDTEEYGVLYTVRLAGSHPGQEGKLCARSVREWTESVTVSLPNSEGEIVAPRYERIDGSVA